MRNENVIVMTEHMKVATKRFNLGEITRADLAKAKAKLSSAMSEVVKAIGEENSLITSYVRVVGEQPSVLRYPKELPNAPLSLEQSLGLGKLNNEGLRIAYYNKKSVEEGHRSALLSLFPSVSLSMNLSYKQPFDINQKAPDRSYTAINITLPIFQAGKEYAAIKNAKYMMQSAKQDYLEAIKTLDESIVSNWNNHEISKAMIRASEDLVSAYSATRESIKKEVDLNIRPILDLLDAEIDLLSARISLIDAKVNHVISAYNLALSVNDVELAL